MKFSYLLCQGALIKRKRAIKIVPITKKEAAMIRSKFSTLYISKPTTNGTRYMEELRAAMNYLKKIRNGEVY